MASYTIETVTTTIRRWIIPAAEPWGAAAAEIGKAWAAADRAYREQNDLGQDASLPDNALTFHPGDDEIVISFEIQGEPV
ncbi:hypothetical protein [Streptomyces sp. NPDC002547]